MLKAKFTPRKSASAPAAGGRASSTYNGLFFQEDAISLASAGSFTLSVTTRGKYSGRILLGAKRYSFSGLLDTTQNSGTNIIIASRRPSPDTRLPDRRQPGRSNLRPSERRDLDGPAVRRPCRIRQSNRAPFAGNYTLVMPGYDGNSTLPAGDSFGTLKVSSAGQVKFVGTLADGTKVSQSATLSQAGYWPLHIPLYSGNGSFDELADVRQPDKRSERQPHLDQAGRQQIKVLPGRLHLPVRRPWFQLPPH